MNRLRKLKFRLISLQLFLIILIMMFSCMRLSELKSPVDGLKLLVNYDIFKTFLSFRYVDAATGSLIGATGTEKVKVEILGASSGAIVDQMGKHATSYESVFGLLSLALNPNDPWKPTQQNKLSLQFNASSPNYKSISTSVQIDSTGKYEYRVMMEKSSVDASGVKKYVLQLPVNSAGELTNDFSYHSSANEASVEVNKGTQFIKADGTVDKSGQVNLVLTVYTSLGAAPLPGSLISDVVLKDNTVLKAAVDIYRVIDLKMTNSASEPLSSSVNNPVVLRYKIDNNAYYPRKKATINSGSDIQIFTYLPKTASWQLDSDVILETDSLGYYVQSGTLQPGLHAAGMYINTCDLTGQLSFSLPGTFPSIPVPTSVYVYRKIDSRYIGNARIDVNGNGFSKGISFKVPENTPVRVNVWNASNANSFSAAPDHFDFDNGCVNVGTAQTVLTSTSQVVSGQVKVNINSGFASDQITVQASIVQSSNNSPLWSQQYTVSKTNPTFNVVANVPANTAAYLRIQAVGNANSFQSVPANISLNTSSATGQSWNYSISPLFIQTNLNFNFTRNADLPPGNYTVRAVLTNVDTGENEGEFDFQVKDGQSAYSAQLLLSKTKKYKINLKRQSGASVFLAYPYEFTPGTITQTDYTYAVELSGVVVKPVDITVKVVCNKSEIIPTLHGYYRTVWEDDWKELDLVNGAITMPSEMNATYILGLIVDGKMETMTSVVDATTYNFNFPLSSDNCAKMGW